MILNTFGKILFTIFYPTLLIIHFIFLRKLNYGKILVFMAIIIAFSGDISSFYIGKFFGKKKLLYKISPGKTIEGSIASILGSLLAIFCLKGYFVQFLAIHHIYIITIMSNILGQFGDLCESLIKRIMNQKDSGNILPGHGGILDRIDSLLFIGPFIYYYNIIFIKL